MSELKSGTPQVSSVLRTPDDTDYHYTCTGTPGGTRTSAVNKLVSPSVSLRGKIILHPPSSPLIPHPSNSRGAEPVMLLVRYPRCLSSVHQIESFPSCRTSGDITGRYHLIDIFTQSVHAREWSCFVSHLHPWIPIPALAFHHQIFCTKSEERTDEQTDRRTTNHAPCPQVRMQAPPTVNEASKAVPHLPPSLGGGRQCSSGCGLG